MKTTGSDPSAVRAAPGPAKFSLAANYDPELVPALAAYPVDEVYGRFPTDGVSSGRPRYLATPLSEAELRRYIHLLDHHGMAFNYLLNGACFGNREWTRSWQKRVTALLTKLGAWACAGSPYPPRFFWNWSNAVSRVQGKSRDLCPGGPRRGAPASGKISGPMPSRWRASRSTGTSPAWRPSDRRSVAICNLLRIMSVS